MYMLQYMVAPDEWIDLLARPFGNWLSAQRSLDNAVRNGMLREHLRIETRV